MFVLLLSLPAVQYGFFLSLNMSFKRVTLFLFTLVAYIGIGIHFSFSPNFPGSPSTWILGLTEVERGFSNKEPPSPVISLPP